MENKQIHAGGICHALVGVQTGRMDRDKTGEAYRTQITEGLLTSFLHIIPYLFPVVGGGASSEEEHGTLDVFNMC